MTRLKTISVLLMRVVSWIFYYTSGKEHLLVFCFYTFKKVIINIDSLMQCEKKKEEPFWILKVLACHRDINTAYGHWHSHLPYRQRKNKKQKERKQTKVTKQKRNALLSMPVPPQASCRRAGDSFALEHLHAGLIWNPIRRKSDRYHQC